MVRLFVSIIFTLLTKWCSRQVSEVTNLVEGHHAALVTGSLWPVLEFREKTNEGLLAKLWGTLLEVKSRGKSDLGNHE
jgi:hypothetical protein